MSSTMAMWDVALPFCQVGARIRCERCGSKIHNPAQGKRYCSERCRKRAERARWKAKWKKRGVNKYIGWRDKV